MARRKKTEDNISYNYSKREANGSVGLSAEAQKALDTGTYGKTNDRTMKYRTSQEQTIPGKSLPVLEGVNNNPDEWQSSLGSKNKAHVDTTRARAKYEQRIEHNPIGKALTEKDKAILYNGVLRMLNNNMTAAEAANDIMTGSSNGNAGMMQGYARNKDWKAEYGKSLEQLIDEYANNESAMKRHTEEIAHSDGDIAKTLGSTYMNAFVKPVMGAKAAIKNLINPESKSAENTNKLARIYSDMSNIAREDVKKGMSDTGKTVYDVGTNVADRVLPYLLPGGKGIGAVGTLFRTAEDKRESLEDRGITGRGAIGQSLVSGGVDAALDVVGLEKIKGLSALKESGNLVKTALGSAAIGGGEQAITSIVNEAIDRVANGKDSVFSTNVANYMAQGMSEDDARTQALIDEAKTIGQETAQGAAFGAVMGVGGKAVNKALNKVSNKIPALTNDADIQKAQKQQADAVNEIQKLSEQIPEGWTAEDLENSVENASKVKNKAKAKSTDTFEYVTTDGKYTLSPTDNGWEIKGADGTSSKVKGGFDKAKSQLDDIYKTTGAETIPDVVPQKRMPASERYSIQTVYAKDGSPRYFVRENTSDTGSKPVEPGKVYKTEAEAQKVIDNLNNQIPEEPNVQTNNSGNLQERLNNLEDKTRYKAALTEQKNALKRDKSNYENGNLTSDAEKRIAQIDEQIKKTQDEISALKGQKRAEPTPNKPLSVEDSGVVPPNNVSPVPPKGGGNPPEPPKTDLSRRYETLKNSDLFQKSEANMKLLENAKEEGVFNKDIESRKKSQEKALQDYLADEEAAINENLSKEWDGGKDVDTSMLILHDALDSGSQAYTNMVLLKQAVQSKKAGRLLRALRDYSYSGTKEGVLAKTSDYLVDAAEKVLKKDSNRAEYKSMAESMFNGNYSKVSKLGMDDANLKKVKDAIANGASVDDVETMLAMYKAVGSTGVSQDALNKVNELYKQIENVPPTSKARADLEADVFKVLAQDVGGKRTWREQWDAWRYLAMLGNPKTHLRNIIGNTTHRMVTEAKDVLGAAIEGAVDKANKSAGGKGIERTKAILSPNDKGLVDLARKDADDVAYFSLNDKGNKYNVKDELSRARDSFNNKTLTKIDDFNSNLLENEDYSALKKKYSKSLARFLKANGADESIFNATDEASKALLDKGRAYAIDQAKQATFHEYSKLAEALTQFSQKMQEDGKLSHKAAGYVLEGLMPFKKTPINILKQGGKYSPIELVKSIGKIYKAARKGGSVPEAIESLASGLTGTGIMALGGFLASQGLLTGSKEADYTVDNAQTEQGSQNYAIQIGDKSYTLDWLAPMALPLFAGVETYNLLQKDKDDLDAFDSFIDGLSTIAEPITEMSMLQGINNTLESLSYSGLKNAIATFGTSAATGYLTQGVPTLAGQFARAIDDTRRSTYSNYDSTARRQVDKAQTKVENKIPWLSMGNEPYVDSRGQEQKNEGLATAFLGNNFVTRLADQMLSPGYYKQGTITDVDKELNRLYEKTGDSAYRKVTSGIVGDNRLSKENFTRYQKLYGKTTDDLYDAMIQTDAYKGLDDAEKVKALQSIQEFSKNLADSEIGGKALEKSQQKLVDIYNEQGKDGIIQYLSDNASAKALGLTHDQYVKKNAESPNGAVEYAQAKEKAKALGIDTNTYIKQEQTNPNGAQGYVDDKQTALDYGFVKKDGTANMKAYYNGVEYAGDDPNSLKAYADYRAQGFDNNADRTEYLMNDNSLTDEQKGRIMGGLKPEKMGKTAKGMYDLDGYAGVWSYYVLKGLADTDGNGRVSKKESDALLNSDNPYVTALPDDQYYFLAGTLYK